MVKKEDIAQKAAQADAAAIVRGESRIDAVLSRDFGNGGKVSVDCSDWSARVRETLAAAYRRAGWTVEYVFDQRDGQALIFS